MSTFVIEYPADGPPPTRHGAATARTITLRQAALDALTSIPAGQWVRLPDIKAGTAHKFGRQMRADGHEVAIRYIGARGSTADVWVRRIATNPVGGTALQLVKEAS